MGGGGNDGGGVLGAGGGSRNVGHPSEFRLAARRLHSLYRLRSIRFKVPCTVRLPACLPRLLTCGVLCATSLAVRVSERRVAAIQECDLSIPDFLPPILPPLPSCQLVTGHDQRPKARTATDQCHQHVDGGVEHRNLVPQLQLVVQIQIRNAQIKTISGGVEHCHLVPQLQMQNAKITKYNTVTKK